MLIISYWFTEKTCYVANSLAGLVTPWTKQLHHAVYTTDSYLWEISSFVVSKLLQWKHLILLFFVINSHKKTNNKRVYISPRSYFFCRTLLKVHRFLLKIEMFSLRLIEQRKMFYKTLIILLKMFANALPESKISLFCSRAFPWVKLASNKSDLFDAKYFNNIWDFLIRGRKTHWWRLRAETCLYLVLVFSSYNNKIATAFREGRSFVKKFPNKLPLPMWPPFFSIFVPVLMWIEHNETVIMFFSCCIKGPACRI